MNEMSNDSGELRGVMIQVAGDSLLLPNASIAEILSVVDPEPIENAPEWLLGQVRWRGWQVPLVDFPTLAGQGGPERNLRGRRALVLKALGGNPRMPFFGVLTQGFPRLVTVSPSTLEEMTASESTGVDDVAVPVLYQGEQVLIPDMDRVEAMLGEALAG